MRNEITKMTKWFKITGKIVYIGFVVETLIAIIIASVVTWNKTYENNQSMFTFQIPLLLLSGFITFCVIDSMSFLGREYERQILRTLVSSDPLFFIKRYIFFGIIFALLITPLSTIMLTNSNAHLDWKIFVSLPLLTIYCSSLFAVTTMISLIATKNWILKSIILILLFQGITSTISFYPFFLSEMSVAAKTTLGTISPIFSCATIMNGLNESFNYVYLIPFIFMFILVDGTTALFKTKVQWKTKSLSV